MNAYLSALEFESANKRDIYLSIYVVNHSLNLPYFHIRSGLFPNAFAADHIHENCSLISRYFLADGTSQVSHEQVTLINKKPFFFFCLQQCALSSPTSNIQFQYRIEVTILYFVPRRHDLCWRMIYLVRLEVVYSVCENGMLRYNYPPNHPRTCGEEIKILVL